MRESCCIRVYGNGMTFRGSICLKPANIQHGGKWYCGTHNPDKVAARQAKNHAEWEAKMVIKRAGWALQAAAPDMLAALQDAYEAEGLLPAEDRSPWFDAAGAAILKATSTP